MDTQGDYHKQEFEAVELSDYLQVLRERWWVIALAVVLLVGSSVLYSLGRTPLYRATAEVIQEPPGLESSLLGTGYLPGNGQQRISGDARVIDAPDIGAGVKTRIDSPRSVGELLGMLTVHPDVQTGVIRLSVVGPEASETAKVANGFAEEFITSRTTAMDAALAVAITVTEDQIKPLPVEERLTEYSLSLKARLQQLNALKDLRRGDYKLLQAAGVPALPFTPQPLRDSLTALAVGLVLGGSLAFLLEHLDRRVKDEEAMEREFGLPVLASIPILGRRWPKGSGKSATGPRSSIPVGFNSRRSPLLEPYRTLRSNLQYYSVDRNLRLLMVTSALPKQGKTVTTVNLGLSLALAGQRVILVECDLRRSMLHNYLGLTNELGVTNVLSGTATFAEAMQLVAIKDFVPMSENGAKGQAGSLHKNLYVIAAGPLPPNPAELIASERMSVMLGTAAENADYVIVDTPPVLLVSDGLALAKQVDGVLITAPIRETTRDDAARTRSLLERHGAHTLGLVVAGSKVSRHYYYKYGYYEQQPPAS